MITDKPTKTKSPPTEVGGDWLKPIRSTKAIDYPNKPYQPTQS